MLVHAGIADRRMWHYYLPWLAANGWHAIAPDLPGFGEHVPSADPPAPWDFLRDVLDELSVDQAVVVGCSFGGAVALRLAVTAPERVRALAMISSPAPGLEPSAQLDAAWNAESDAMERGDIDAAVDAVVAAWLAPGAPDELRDLVATMQRRAFELDPEGTMPQPADPLQEAPERLRAIDVPVARRGRRDRHARLRVERAGPRRCPPPRVASHHRRRRASRAARGARRLPRAS